MWCHSLRSGFQIVIHICVNELSVAALCNAHAFESAHPQSYVIAHKLRTCRFEVNSLHINPIIGENVINLYQFSTKFSLF